MIVGEAPGADEEREGRPFVGKSGELLRHFLMGRGIDPDSCYMTNICKYRPPSNELRRFFSEGKDGGEPNELVLEGMLELREEINRVNPNVVLSCGSFPLWALTGKARWRQVKGKVGGSFWTYTGIQDWRGSILESRDWFGQRKVIPTLHPAYILREGMADHASFIADLERLSRESLFPEIRRPQREFILDPRGNLRSAVRDRLLSPRSTITVDIEYFGKDLICVGMTNSKEWATTIQILGPEDLAFCKEILESGLPLNAQNAMFDVSILEWHYGFDVMRHLAFDTMLAAHAIAIELPKGLDYLCSIYTDQPYYKDMVDWKAVKLGKQPIAEVLEYNCIDCVVQHEVMEKQLEEDLSDPRVRRVFDFEMSLLPELWEVSKRGMRIDQEKLDKLIEATNSEILIRQTLLNELAGSPINVKSGKDIPYLLVDVLGVKLTKKTPGGAWACDDKTLAEVLPRCQTKLQSGAIKIIRELRQKRDLLSKFAEVERDEDDRSRGMYNPAGTTTGRLSSKKFYPTGRGHQQQNIPRKSSVRSVFVPDPGLRFGYADLERAESLVVAHLTNDPLMLAHHAPGVDAHKELAALIFEKPVDEINKDERYLGKQTRHAGNYMEGPKIFQLNVNKLAHETGVWIEFSEAKAFIARYRELHPFLVAWWKETEQELWRSRTLFNLLGRHRTFFNHIGSILPEAVAFVPQSTVGDVLNAGLLNVAGKPCAYCIERCNQTQILEDSRVLREGGFSILNQVHDAIGFQYDPQCERDVLSALRRLMSIPLVAPKTYEDFIIPVEIAIGESWGEVQKWDED